jgi:hypothetical protein
MKEQVKTTEITRKQMKRVSPQQRDAMLEDFSKIADGNESIENQLVESYDAKHLVVGERFDNWKSIKDFSPELKTLAEAVADAMDNLNAQIIDSKLLLNKRGSDAQGVPFVQHKVEIMVD